MLTASAHFKSIYNPWYLSSQLSPSLVITSLPLSLSLSLLLESIFHEATELSWQAEEEGFRDELLAPVRRSRAGGEGWMD